MTDEEESDEYSRGFKAGYRMGENERIALATANSELRSQARQRATLVRLLADDDYDNHDHKDQKK